MRRKWAMQPLKRQAILPLGTERSVFVRKTRGKRKTLLFAGILSSLLASLFLFSGTCFAEIIYSEQTDLASLEDEAELLYSYEQEELLEKAGELSEKTGFEIRLVTTEDAEGESSQVYAENYFESLTENEPGKAHGGCYLIDMDNREFYVATYGNLQYYLTDDRLDSLLDDAYDEASSGDFYGVFSEMLSDTEKFYLRGIADGTRIYDEDTGTYTYYKAPKTITPFKLATAFFSGVLAFLALFVPTLMSYGMKGKDKNDYSEKDNVSLNLIRKQDDLVNRRVTQRHIPRDNPSRGGGGGGGGSHTTTVHHTSGGYTAGGGGRKF